MCKMDKPITINNVIDNLEVVSSSISSIYRSGTFEKFTDKEKICSIELKYFWITQSIQIGL